MTSQSTPTEFLARLQEQQSDDELRKVQRYFKSGKGQYAEGDRFIGVRMGTVFQIARDFIDMPVDGLETLMESEIHEARAGAMSIMDKCARRKKTPEERRKALFDLYIRRHDRINSWDLVDLAAPHVVGGYLYDKPRDLLFELYIRRHDRINSWDLVDLAAPHVVGGYLYDKPRDLLFELARSDSVWERRTAIVATSYFIRQGDLDDTFAIAEILIGDNHDLIHKAVGGWIRECGKKHRTRHLAFLDAHASRMPRTMLRYAIEHLDNEQKDHYRAMQKRYA